MPELFAPEDLAAYLQQDLDLATVERCRRVAAGWLRSATGLTAWPDPITDDLWTWAVELAAMAYDNPAAWANETTGGEVTGYSAIRRREILDAAKAAYPGGSGGGPQTPVGAFPAAQPYPDPARCSPGPLVWPGPTITG